MSGSENEFEHILYREERGAARITLNCPERGNALSAGLIAELHRALDLAENREEVRLVVLQANGESFCAGMDFAEAATTQLSSQEDVRRSIEPFYELLERLSMLPKMVVCLVEAKVNAGGVGLVAACDVVIATEAATFGLSEILFGLLPATVLPFLIRRTGCQPAYFMTLTAARLDAAQSKAIRLVDELTDSPKEALRRKIMVANRLRPEMVAILKQYMRGLVPLTEETKTLAIDQITNLLWNPDTIEGIRNFVEDQSMPWEKR